jgi:hypothetical protein
MELAIAAAVTAVAVILAAAWLLTHPPRPRAAGRHREPPELYIDEAGQLQPGDPGYNVGLADIAGQTVQLPPSIGPGAWYEEIHPAGTEGPWLTTSPGTRMEIDNEGTVTFHDPPEGYGERLLDTDARGRAYQALAPEALAAEADGGYEADNPDAPFGPVTRVTEDDRLAAEYDAQQAGAWAAQCAEDDRRQLGSWHAEEARWFDRMLSDIHRITIPEG